MLLVCLQSLIVAFPGHTHLHFGGKTLRVTLFVVVDFEEFQNLLIKQSPIEGYTEWLDDIVDKCVLQVNELNP